MNDPEPTLDPRSIRLEYKGDELWWCNSHGRKATHLNRFGDHVCAPGLGGILLPCMAVNLTGLVEITEEPDPRLGIPATDLCQQCEGTGWAWIYHENEETTFLSEPIPCPKCTARAFST